MEGNFHLSFLIADWDFEEEEFKGWPAVIWVFHKLNAIGYWAFHDFSLLQITVWAANCHLWHADAFDELFIESGKRVTVNRQNPAAGISLHDFTEKKNPETMAPKQV